MKIKVPKSQILSAGRCDCTDLPGTTLPFITSLQKALQDGVELADKPEQTSGSPESPALSAPDSQADDTDATSKGFFSSDELNLPTIPTAKLVTEPVYVEHYNNEQGGGSILHIGNRTHEEVEVQQLWFGPQKVFKFEAQDHTAFWARARKSNAQTIVLDKNLGREGKHGEYTLDCQGALALSPLDEERALTVVINNSDHFGWGLEGDLTLRTEQGDTTIANSRVLFVSLKDE